VASKQQGVAITIAEMLHISGGREGGGGGGLGGGPGGGGEFYLQSRSEFLFVRFLSLKMFRHTGCEFITFTNEGKNEGKIEICGCICKQIHHRWK
jgi:hypothetical protein